MATESSDQNNNNNGSSRSNTFKPTWKLPDGIEDYVETAILQSAVGMTIGGLAGLVLFRSGRGYRAACIAAGLGTALGSTYQRYIMRPSIWSSSPSSGSANKDP